MHKSILKFFGFLKNFAYFLKIFTMFYIMLHLLYWIQNLISGQFVFLKPFSPILKLFVSAGELVSDNGIELFGAAFEFKYFIALLIYVGIYFIFNFILISLEQLEDKYDDVHRFVKKTQENNCNRDLRTTQENIERRIFKYKIAVKTAIKNKFSHEELGIDLNEQNLIMNKYLIEKTGVVPVEFEGGFLYSFDNFFQVDSVLSIFFKLIKSNSPLQFAICIQVLEENEEICLNELRMLTELKLFNKIIMLSNTHYRYKFNNGHKYGTSQLGLFQKENDTIEVFEYIEI